MRSAMNMFLLLAFTETGLAFFLTTVSEISVEGGSMKAAVERVWDKSMVTNLA